MAAMMFLGHKKKGLKERKIIFTDEGGQWCQQHDLA